MVSLGQCFEVRASSELQDGCHREVAARDRQRALSRRAS